MSATRAPDKDSFYRLCDERTYISIFDIFISNQHDALVCNASIQRGRKNKKYVVYIYKTLSQKHALTLA